MTNLGYDDMEDEVNFDDGIDDITVERKFSVKTSDVLPWFERYRKFQEDIKLKDNLVSDAVKEFVLPFLPAKSICRFKAVSKKWNQWISNPFLSHLQSTHFKDISGLLCQPPGLNPSFISFNHHAYGIPSPAFSFLPGLVNIVTTCNGLVCCQSLSEDWGCCFYYICNPVTKEWKMLPQPTYFHGPETAVALAFEPTTLDFSAHYELVCAVCVDDNDVSIVIFEIYSSELDYWRISETICSEPDVLNPSKNGFYMKGFVYWTTKSGAILIFDLKDEQYGILPLPAGNGPHGALTQMHGELCYLLPQIQEGECRISVYGSLDMSLKHVIRLQRDVLGVTFSHCRVLACVNSDVLIILLSNWVIAYQTSSTVMAYHVKEQKMEVLSEVGTEGFANCVCLPYINTMVAVA